MADNADAADRLPYLPSTRQITSDENEELAKVKVILSTILNRELHLPPNSMSHVAQYLWTREADGPFDGQFRPWSAGRVNRAMSAVIALLEKYANYEARGVRHPSPIEVDAKRIVEEKDEAEAERVQRTATERALVANRAEANDFRELAYKHQWLCVAQLAAVRAHEVMLLQVMGVVALAHVLLLL